MYLCLDFFTCLCKLRVFMHICVCVFYSQLIAFALQDFTPARYPLAIVVLLRILHSKCHHCCLIYTGSPDFTRLYVTGFDLDTTDADLRTHFPMAIDIVVPMRKRGSQPFGYSLYIPMFCSNC